MHLLCEVHPTLEVPSHLRLSTVPDQCYLRDLCYQLRVTLFPASQAVLMYQSSRVERRWLTRRDALVDVAGEKVSVHGMKQI